MSPDVACTRYVSNRQSLLVQPIWPTSSSTHTVLIPRNPSPHSACSGANTPHARVKLASRCPRCHYYSMRKQVLVSLAQHVWPTPSSTRSPCSTTSSLLHRRRPGAQAWLQLECRGLSTRSTENSRQSRWPSPNRRVSGLKPRSNTNYTTLRRRPGDSTAT